MPIKWNEQQRQIGLVILKHRRDGGSGYDLNAVMGELPNIPDSTISKVAQALKESNWVMPAMEKPRAKAEGGKLATVVAKQPAPVVFQLGDQVIELDAQCLYESYLLYSDLRVRGLIQRDGFSSVIRDGVGLIWRFLINRPIVEGTKVIVEEGSHGGSTG